MLRSFREKLRALRGRGTSSSLVNPFDSTGVSQQRDDGASSIAGSHHGRSRHGAAAAHEKQSSFGKNSLEKKLGRRERELYRSSRRRAKRERERPPHAALPNSPAPRKRASSSHARASGSIRGEHAQPDTSDAEQISEAARSTTDAEEEAVSSLPSTNISADDFLNDAVPVMVTRRDRRPLPRPPVLTRTQSIERSRSPVPANSFSAAGTVAGPHSFGTASGTSSRRRSALWKRSFNAQALCDEQGIHSDNVLLAAVMECGDVEEDVVVAAAERLSKEAENQLPAMTKTIQELETLLKDVKFGASALPSTRHPRFESLLFSSETTIEQQATVAGVSPAFDVSFRDLAWNERIWDVESMLAERRLGDAVAAVQALRQDDDFPASASRTIPRLNSLVDQIASQICAKCEQGSLQSVIEYAALLARLGRHMTAYRVVLSSSHSQLHDRLARLTPGGQTDLTKHVVLVQRMTFANLCSTHESLLSLPCAPSPPSSLFVEWATAHIDSVYFRFLAPQLAHAKNFDVPALTVLASTVLGKVSIMPASSTHDDVATLFRARALTNLRRCLHALCANTRVFLLARARAHATSCGSLSGLADALDAWVDAVLAVARGLPGLADDALDASLAAPAMAFAAARLSAGDEAQANIEVSQLGARIRTHLSTHGLWDAAPRMRQVANALATGKKEQVVALAADITAMPKDLEFGAGRMAEWLESFKREREAWTDIPATKDTLFERARVLLGQQRLAAACTPSA